jgi:hypothetical protein
MNDEKVFQLLMETNPVPDPDGLDSPIALAQPVGRNPNMATSERISTEPTRIVRDPSRRSRILIGAAAALVVIVGIGTAVVIGGDKDAATEPEVAVVLSAIEARNSGDIEAYKAYLSGAELSVENRSNLSEALSYANNSTILANCRVSEKTPTEESVVECDATQIDDFYGAGGIEESGTARFHVTDDDKINDSGVSVDGEEDVPWEETEMAIFNVAFFSWLADAHPAVFDGIQTTGFEPQNIPGLAAFPGDSRDPAEMLIAVEYVAEFVAQSDVYPINQ